MARILPAVYVVLCMGEPRVLKGVYKDGPAVASIVIDAENRAKILVKGIEPRMPRDPGFLDLLKKVVEGCKPHLAGTTDVELCVVLVQSPNLAEHATATPAEIQALGLARLTAMDGDGGILVRATDSDPSPTALSYHSLKAGSSEQPGLVEVAPTMPRLSFKTLQGPQQQIYAALVQLAGRALLKAVPLDDGGLKLALGLRDLPPSRARSLVLPLGDYATEIAGGAKLEDVAKKVASKIGL